MKFDYKSIEELRDRVKNHITQTVYDIRKVSTFRRLMEYLKNFLQSSVRALKGLSIKRVAPKESIKPRVYDEKKYPPIGSAQLPAYKWDAQNFEGFWYDHKGGISSETLDIGGPLGSALITTLDHHRRTIPENTLVYQTIRQKKTLKAVENGITSTELRSSFLNGQYYILGWRGEKCIALKGKANKLVKLIFEHSATDKKTLQVGEIWDMGDGWALRKLLMPRQYHDRYG